MRGAFLCFLEPRNYSTPSFGTQGISIPLILGPYVLNHEEQEDGKRVLKGSTAFPDGETIVRIFEAGDRSTFLHEMAHVFLEFRRQLSLIEGAPEAAREDWTKIVTWLEIENIDFSKELSENE